LFSQPVNTAPMMTASANPAAVVVVVDGKDITQGEIDGETMKMMDMASRKMPPERIAQMKDRFAEQAMENLILKTILVGQIDKAGVTISDEEKAEAITKFTNSLPAGVTMDDLIAKNNWTKEEFDKNLTMDLRINKLLESQTQSVAQPTEADLKKFYDENKERFDVPESVTASHILIATEATDDDAAGGAVTASGVARRRSDRPPEPLRPGRGTFIARSTACVVRATPEVTMNRIQSRSSTALRQAIASQLQPFSVRRGIAIVAGVSAAAVLLSPVVQAAESEGTALAEIIVTATRHEERLIDVPVSASVLAGETLAAIGSAGDDVRQLAFRVPSLNIESSNGRTFPRFYIRGYGNTDFTSFASQPVSLVYDDVVQENPALKGFPIFDQADVEVLRGPQGTLFGRNSPAGVVKLESAKPVLGQFSGSGSLSDGTYNTSVLEAVVNLPVSESVAMRFSTQGQHRDNWVDDPINHTKLEGYDDWAARVQLLYKPSDTFSALFNVHGRALGGSARLFRANIIQLGTNSLVPGFDPAKFYADGYNGQSYSMAGGNVHLTWTLPTVTIQSITGYETILHYNTIGDIDGGYGAGNVFCNFDASCAATPSGPGFIPFPVETGGGIKHHRQITQEVRALWNLSAALTAQAGVFLFDEDVEDS
ncbi:MAG: TonB-dependent receptor plug domain-containing protein, partial [Deltaproteobacteria bacterium]